MVNIFAIKGDKLRLKQNLKQQIGGVNEYDWRIIEDFASQSYTTVEKTKEGRILLVKKKMKGEDTSNSLIDEDFNMNRSYTVKNTNIHLRKVSVSLLEVPGLRFDLKYFEDDSKQKSIDYSLHPQ
ncbi:MAG: hypothetical protein AAF518_26395, partial [Spirochaetota bacterium]